MKICVIGFGTVGGAIVRLLQGHGYKVTCIAKDMPAMAGAYRNSDFSLPSNNDLALGNMNSSDFEWSNKLFASSYSDWMKKIEDPMHTATLRATRITQYWPNSPKSKGTPDWANIVKGYMRENEEFISYDSFALAPVMLGCVRYERAFVEGMGVFENRELTEEEKALLRAGESLPGFAMTIIAMGLSIKIIWPDYEIDAVSELMVNLPRDWNTGSFVDEKRKLFVASQPNRLVVNGFLDSLVDLTEEQKQKKALDLIEEVNERFSLKLDAGDIRSVVVNHRPSVQGPPKIDFSNEAVPIVVGSERKGGKLSESIGREVFNKVKKLLGEPRRAYDKVAT